MMSSNQVAKLDFNLFKKTFIKPKKTQAKQTKQTKTKILETIDTQNQFVNEQEKSHCIEYMNGLKLNITGGQ